MSERVRDTWRTPTHVLEYVITVFGRPIGLDPATSRDNPTDALRIFTREDNSLSNGRWVAGTIFLNPPFSLLYPFAQKLVRADAEQTFFIGSYSLGAKWARLLHDNGYYLIIPHKRIKFEAPEGVEDPKCPYPTTMWYRGPNAGRLVDAYEEVYEGERPTAFAPCV